MSPGWLHLQNIICLSFLGFGEFGKQIRVAAQCKQPNPDGRYTLSVLKSSYAANAVVRVLCNQGYRPLVKEITCKRIFTVFRWSGTPHCIAQCKKPNSDGRYSLSVEKEFYDVDEVVTVRCNEGHRPLVKEITCRRSESEDQWDSTPQCVAQCKKPYPDGRYSLSVEKEYYDVDEVVTVRCNEGHRPLGKEIRCRRSGSAVQWDRTPWCIAERCKKPENTDNYTLSGSGNFYNFGESVTVQCRTGYRPLHERISCVAPRRRSEWDNNPQCVAQCKKPNPDGTYSLSVEKEYYDVDEVVPVRCNEGHRPLVKEIRCRRSGSAVQWDRTPQCIAQCKKPNPDGRYSLSVEKEYYNVDEVVTVLCNEGHRPPVKKIGCRRSGSVVQWDGTPQCIVPNLPHIVKGPSMEDGRMRWSLLNRQGIVTGYKVEIAARRDYDPSFSGNESHWLPPNVTECEILLQRGTNYTVTIRAMTSSGDGRSAVYMIETPPGGGRSNLTGPSDSNTSLDLASMLWLTVPILTVKLLILVVLLKIQFTLMAGKSPESDLVRHEELGNGILYRKREEGIVLL